MPGIANEYFRIPALAPNVHFMTFALGVFRRQPPGPAFTGLVRGDRVRDVSALGTVNDLLADWDSALVTLAELAADGPAAAADADTDAATGTT